MSYCRLKARLVKVIGIYILNGLSGTDLANHLYQLLPSVHSLPVNSLLRLGFVEAGLAGSKSSHYRNGDRLPDGPCGLLYSSLADITCAYSSHILALLQRQLWPKNIKNDYK